MKRKQEKALEIENSERREKKLAPYIDGLNKSESDKRELKLLSTKEEYYDDDMAHFAKLAKSVDYYRNNPKKILSTDIAIAYFYLLPKFAQKYNLNVDVYTSVQKIFGRKENEQQNQNDENLIEYLDQIEHLAHRVKIIKPEILLLPIEYFFVSKPENMLINFIIVDFRAKVIGIYDKTFENFAKNVQHALKLIDEYKNIELNLQYDYYLNCRIKDTAVNACINASIFCTDLRKQRNKIYYFLTKDEHKERDAVLQALKEKRISHEKFK